MENILPAPMSITASFNEPVTTKVKSVALSSLWEKTDAIMPDNSGDFISLRVCMAERPISLREGDGWFAAVTALPDHKWNVLLWRRQLNNERLFTDEQDKKAVQEIIKEAKGLLLEIWTVLPASYNGAASSLNLRPLG